MTKPKYALLEEINNAEVKLSVGIMTANTRETTPKGTVFASAIRSFNPRNRRSRMDAQFQNTVDVKLAYTRHYGLLHGRTYSIKHTFLTAQIVTELEVMP